MVAVMVNALHALGGVGLFLLGMIWLTEGLRGLAGAALRRLLARFTRSPVSGALAGAAATAVIQSSSATTVTTVGFVSAGLLTFPQALGIIFGANVGTTLTGWLIAILGFKLNLGELALPLVFAGALLRLLGSPHLKMVGTALAGFSLLFIGLDAMKEAMFALQGLVTPSSFPADTWFGRFQLLLIGVAITLITQSSSAGVATALAALGAGAISFPQAAAMVIGMNVGTTFTAALATLGGTTATRRTGLSHVIYNVLTGLMAFILLTPFALLVQPLLVEGEDQIALVAFHTAFNALGVIVVLPFAKQFANFVVALVPERGPHLTRRLGSELLADQDAAMDAVAATIAEISREQFHDLADRLDTTGSARDHPARLRAIADALTETRVFVARLSSFTPDTPRTHRITAALHALDHLRRLYYRRTQTKRIETLREDHRLRRLAGMLRAVTLEVSQSTEREKSEVQLNRLRRVLRRQRETYRNRIILWGATGRLDDEAAGARLDAMRWLHRVSYHLWRTEHHLGRLETGSGAAASPRREAAIEVLED
jgi:phosphate:Na+ symporter